MQSDVTGIHALTNAAFAGKPYSNGSEPAVINGLREGGDLTLSLVAENADGLAGHIAFSPVTISGLAGLWFGLGPVSVWPRLQGLGIGGALVRRGIADMREMGAAAIFLLGDPDYYGRFGFESDPRLSYPGPPAAYFQYLVLSGDMPQGEVRFAPAFDAA